MKTRPKAPRPGPRPGQNPGQRPGGGRRTAQAVVFIALAAAVIGVIWLAVTHPNGIGGGDGVMRIVLLLLLLVMVASGLAIRSMKDLRRSFRHIGLWMVVFAGLIAGYGFKPEAEMLWRRMAAVINPAGGAAGEDSVSYAAARGGHFIINADVDGVTVQFLVDTGASRVVLSHRDARRLGFDPEALKYTQPFNSANGQGWGAPVRLGHVSAGPVTVNDVRATVNQTDMDTSLLGMTFLSNTGGYSVENSVLTIRR